MPLGLIPSGITIIRGDFMEIIFTDEAKEVLSTMGTRFMTIYTEIVGSCWSPRTEAFVKLRKPGALEDYILYEADGIKIYIYKEAVFETEKLIIDRAKYVSDLANQEFDVIGLKL